MITAYVDDSGSWSLRLQTTTSVSQEIIITTCGWKEIYFLHAGKKKKYIVIAKLCWKWDGYVVLEDSITTAKKNDGKRSEANQI